MGDENVHARLHAVESDVHSIRTDVAVLRSEFDSGMGSIVEIGKDVKIISGTLQMQQGAMKFVRILWATVGGVIAFLALLVSYMAMRH